MADKKSRLAFADYITSLNTDEGFQEQFDSNYQSLQKSIFAISALLEPLDEITFQKLKSDLLPVVKDRGYSKLEEIFHSHSISCDRFLELGASPGGMTRCIFNYFKSSNGVAHVYYGPDKIDYLNDFRNLIVLKENRSAGYNGDLVEYSQVEYLIDKLNGYFDLIVADCCSRKGTEDSINDELIYHQVHIMKHKLKYGGTFVLKVFMTDQLRPILSDATKYFHALSMFKPRSANPLNNEMYFVFMNKRICSKKIVNYLNVEESKNYYTSTVKKITNFLSSYTRGEVSSMMGDDEVFNMRDRKSVV